MGGSTDVAKGEGVSSSKRPLFLKLPSYLATGERSHDRGEWCKSKFVCGRRVDKLGWEVDISTFRWGG